MKIAKKVLAVVMAIAMIGCLTAMAFAADTSVVLKAGEVKDGKVSVDVIVKNAAGLKTFDTEVTYDAAVLSVPTRKGVVDGPYLDEYVKCDEKVITIFNSTTAGSILPGVAFPESVYTDAEWKAICDECGVESKITTDSLVLFTINFNVAKDTKATETTIKCGTASVTVKLAAEPESAAPAAEATTAVAPTEKPTDAAVKTGDVNTGDTMAIFAAAGVVALAGAAFVVSKKRK